MAGLGRDRSWRDGETASASPLSRTPVGWHRFIGADGAVRFVPCNRHDGCIDSWAPLDPTLRRMIERPSVNRRG